MATLHTPTAFVATADMPIKLPDDDARDGQFFLVLPRDGGFDDPAAARRSDTSYRSSTREGICRRPSVRRRDPPSGRTFRM